MFDPLPSLSVWFKQLLIMWFQSDSWILISSTYRAHVTVGVGHQTLVMVVFFKRTNSVTRTVTDCFNLISLINFSSFIPTGRC